MIFSEAESERISTPLDGCDGTTLAQSLVGGSKVRRRGGRRRVKARNAEDVAQWFASFALRSLLFGRFTVYPSLCNGPSSTYRGSHGALGSLEKSAANTILPSRLLFGC